MRHTPSSVAVGRALLEEPDRARWGYELRQVLGMPSGVLYPILRRMVVSGWLSLWPEDPETILGGRRPRKYVRLTEEGRTELDLWLAQADEDSRFSLDLVVEVGRVPDVTSSPDLPSGVTDGVH
jgi:PadR family transcriptional regulator PadR